MLRWSVHLTTLFLDMLVKNEENLLKFAVDNLLFRNLRTGGENLSVWVTIFLWYMTR